MSENVPRISPVAPEAQTAEQQATAGRVGIMTQLNLFATMLHHPTLLERYLPFGTSFIIEGALPRRDKELLILRVAWRCASPYEWARHIALARAAGCTPEDIRRMRDEPVGAAGPDADGALVRAVDDLIDQHRVQDATWARLAGSFSEQQLIELVMLIGHYVMLAGYLNSCGVQLEQDLPTLGEVPD